MRRCSLCAHVVSVWPLGRERLREAERELVCSFSGNEESFVPGKWRNKSQPYSDASLHEEWDHKQMSLQPEQKQTTLNQIKTHPCPHRCVHTPHRMSADFPFAKSALKCRDLAKVINLVFSFKSIWISPWRNPAVKHSRLQLTVHLVLSFNQLKIKWHEIFHTHRADSDKKGKRNCCTHKTPHYLHSVAAVSLILHVVTDEAVGIFEGNDFHTWRNFKPQCITLS